ncbi:hypothetical protein TNIN_270231 [Trichonephila inaurata madagascariensis]|uniref:Uncharacterized protein n=1 Tax=Trichonephila inaurata madagascariensis TaxID=2747483 RepID=A0A8X6X594_9ARAC|nr:hypothetical protein TNIN_270231 [Trichonephila inaurata madagascariensis]
MLSTSSARSKGYNSKLQDALKGIKQNQQENAKKSLGLLQKNERARISVEKDIARLQRKHAEISQQFEDEQKNPDNAYNEGKHRQAAPSARPRLERGRAVPTIRLNWKPYVPTIRLNSKQFVPTIRLNWKQTVTTIHLNWKQTKTDKRLQQGESVPSAHLHQEQAVALMRLQQRKAGSAICLKQDQAKPEISLKQDQAKPDISLNQGQYGSTQRLQQEQVKRSQRPQQEIELIVFNCYNQGFQKILNKFSKRISL